MTTILETPWGPAQNIEKIGDGVTFVSTASHGGVRVVGKATEKLSKAAKKVAICTRGPKGDNYWFEEDCKWVVAAWEFEDLRNDFNQQVDVGPEQFTHYLRTQLGAWNLEYALAVGAITVDNLPEETFCPDYAGHHWLDKELLVDDSKVTCSCGHAFS